MTVHTENAFSVQVMMYLPVDAMPREMIVSEEPYDVCRLRHYTLM